MLLIFTKERSTTKFNRDTEEFFNPKITKKSFFVGLTQKYNSISKDVREQIQWLCLFFTKDRDNFEDCLRENDVVLDKNERDVYKIGHIQNLF